MSVDKLQELIRKTKNPSVIDFTLYPQQLPSYLMEAEGTYPKAYFRFCQDLLLGLKGIVPAVRFSFPFFALMGLEGLELMPRILTNAKDLGYYVLLDGIDALSPQLAQNAADALMKLPCDGIILSAYIGTDGMKPYVKQLKDSGKSLFVVLRTANKTAPELQDLMTGSRLVYMVGAQSANLLGEPLVGKSGYSQIGGLAAASSADCLRQLRSKYKRLFLLLDGYDYPNSNAKNCSYAFDQLGHGAAACAGSSVTTAWRDEQAPENEFVACAVRSAERMKKNITRYITVL
ncbi:MAG: hypothetical protein IJO45_02050 [Oscillospiraceae bacterium]|nr:hypothetical protein [Oscillospiraceae bacterium]